MKTKNKILFLLGLILLPIGLGLIPLYIVLKKKANRYYIACLLPRLCLWLLQPFFKQDTYILFDTTSTKTQLIDNYTLFLEMQKYNIKSYYLCLKSHPQFNELRNVKGVIGFNNIDLLYYTLFFKLIKTKFVLESFGNLINSTFKEIRKNKKTDLVFNQHGITFFKDGFINENNYSKKNYDRIVISNDFEKQIFEKVGFKDKDFIKAGLPRWDLLQDTKENAIFVYFTHRYTFWECDDKNYKDSLYFKNFEKLLKSIQGLNTKVYVAVHHAIREHLKEFEINNIEFVSEFEIDRIKNKTSLLITDYSSMCFEYLYKDKPVVFYRLDKDDKFLCKFDKEMQEEMSKKDSQIFNMFYKEKQVITKVKSYIKNDFKLEKKNEKIADNFFFFRHRICTKIIASLFWA